MNYSVVANNFKIQDYASRVSERAFNKKITVQRLVLKNLSHSVQVKAVHSCCAHLQGLSTFIDFKLFEFSIRQKKSPLHAYYFAQNFLRVWYVYSDRYFYVFTLMSGLVTVIKYFLSRSLKKRLQNLESQYVFRLKQTNGLPKNFDIFGRGFVHSMHFQLFHTYEDFATYSCRIRT